MPTVYGHCWLLHVLLLLVGDGEPPGRPTCTTTVAQHCQENLAQLGLLEEVPMASGGENGALNVELTLDLRGKVPASEQGMEMHGNT